MTHSDAHHHDTYSKTVFGFWLYLMTDCILFSSLFATYAVLQNGVAGGPTGKDIFNLPFVLTETLILLTSSFTCALAMTPACCRDLKKLVGWFAATFVLGIIFLGMMMSEFTHLYAEGITWKRSAFLSSYFTLIGTHGVHIFFGLLFMVLLVGQAIRRGLTETVLMRLTCLRLFWLLLDVVWIATFTLVYLMGAK